MRAPFSPILGLQANMLGCVLFERTTSHAVKAIVIFA
jgi:hypothetical protein